MKRLAYFFPVIFLVFFLVPQVFFIVNETDQVIVTQFGEYKQTVKEPGLHTKLPFVQVTHRFDKRILYTDAASAEYLTLDKKRLVADPVVLWRIDDPLLFYKTVRDPSGARARLEDIIFSELRRSLAEHEFSKIISTSREPIMDQVAKSALEQAKQFGIHVVDVRFERADLPVEVQNSVFARMVAERERIAKRYRSEGEEESAKVRATTDKERTIILAKAYEESQKIRGDGDGESTRIYAQAYNSDPEFYRFVRSLEFYEKSIPDNSSLFLSLDSKIFKYLNPKESSSQ